MPLAIGTINLRKLLNPVTALTASHWWRQNMKPTIQIENESRLQKAKRLPAIDFNFQAISAGHSAGCASLRRPSFRNISRAYFDTEANNYFLVEAAVFAAIMLTAALPLINGASAVLNLIRSCAGI